MRKVTAWYNLFLNQPVLNTKQTNDGIFSKKAGENFNSTKIF